LISLSPGLVVGRKLRLDREIARGGMGSVWAAFNTQLEAPVAVKFMSPTAVGSPELVSRFQREAKAAAQIRSPHVVQIYEHGVHIGLPYIVMELLEGEDLGKRLSRAGKLTLPQAAEIVTQVCKALRRAHEMGIIHRDLKPANVFLARHDDDEEIVKVLDFGIAKSLVPSGDGEQSTQTGTLVGTPHYMSPEQAQRSREIDARSDLWSLGIIAYRALTGKVPFKGDDMINVLVKVCTEPIPAPTSLAPELPPAVDAFFEHALCRDPDGRFQSAREMSDAFLTLVGRRVMYSEISFAPPMPTPAPRAPVAVPPPPSGPVSRPPVSAPVPRPSQPVAMPLPASGTLPSQTDFSGAAAQPVDAESPPRMDGGARPSQGAPILAMSPGGTLPMPTPVPGSAPQPLPVPPPPPSQGAFGTLAATEASLVVPPLRPSRMRALAVLGGAALALVIGLAVWAGSSGSASSSASQLAPGALATASASGSAAVSLGVPAGSEIVPGAGASASASATASASAAVSASASATAPATASAPSPSGSASVKTPDAPASARPTATSKSSASPRSTSAPKPTGAIGGAPKF
jgi:serine/threonine-protein kinase